MVDVGIDLFIFVKLISNLDMGEYNLAKAEILYISDTGQPLIGLITINKDIDYSKENSLEYFESIILHQFIHILGFSKYSFENIFSTKIKIKSNPYEEERKYIASEKVLIVSEKYFICDSVDDNELEKDG